MPYALSAMLVLVIALRGFFAHERIFGKIIAANLTGSGVFLLFVAIARRAPEGTPDPVVHALVLTSIVVSVSSTALALALLRRLVESPAAGSSDSGDAEERASEPGPWERRCGD
jgi:multicomponent Na+:H+ antiporter subunit C